MAEINVKLTDGNIVSVEEDSYSYKGCPTCDFGSEYIKELKFVVDVDWSEKQQIVEINSNTMYEYAEELNAASVIRLFVKVVEESVDFQGFIELCKKMLNIENNRDIEIKVYEE